MKKIKVHFPGVGSGEAYNINKVDKKIAKLQARNDELVALVNSVIANGGYDTIPHKFYGLLDDIQE